MIEIKNLTKEFKLENRIFKAIDDVSLTIPTGCIYGIIGMSGAGKSTLVRCINRLEIPSEGKILIDGVNINSISEHELMNLRKEIGMIFQSFNLFNQKNVYENIAYPLKLMKMSKKEISDRVDELLKFIDMEDKKKAFPYELSGGQKQRVAIARALATKPKILLSDEGTSALDPANTAQILSLIKKAVDELGMTVVMITHQMEVAKEICDQISVMEKGKIIESNDVESIFRTPKHKLTRTFVDSLSLNNTDNNEEIDFTKFSGRIFRISYKDSTTDEPMLSHCIRKFNIDINLISGNISNLKTGRIGHMYIEMQGKESEINDAKEYLIKSGLIVEGVNA